MSKQQIEEIIDAAKMFEVSTNVDCKYIEFEKDSICAFRPCQHSFCQLVQKTENKYEVCQDELEEGYMQAKRFGVPYIFYCSMGLVHVIAPVERETSIKGALICGPLLISDKYEYLFEEIAIKYKISTSSIQDFLSVIEQVDTTEPHKVTALSRMLGMVANSLSSDVGKLNNIIRNQVQKEQGNIHSILIENSGNRYTFTYSMEKEKLLIASIKDCDMEKARELLNSILGDLFVITGSDLEMIRTRVLELMVLLSRGAVEGGVSTSEIFGLNGQYIREILEMNTVDELYFRLNQMLIRFVESVFIFRGMKHRQSIHEAVTYINKNYMNKITLEEVASFIYVSPTYFSKIFKEEIGVNFAIYLNGKRIEVAKKLLKDKEITLIDIAYLVGFEDQSYFSRVFKKYAGVSPKRYRETNID
ncbi:MAG: PocR ligand-binding domain-containing protein [Niameybacter sp.]